MDNNVDIRLQVFLARAGIASRRNSEHLITAGRVQVNGRTVTKLGTKVSQSDSVTLDGEAVIPEKSKQYIAVNKPAGYICANSDPQDRPLVTDLFGNSFHERLFHVGRLDMSSTGLLFYTNDGDFARIINHPSSEIEKEYIVKTSRPLTKELLEQFKTGITIEGTRFQIKDYVLKGNNTVHIILLEGKNREIRTLFESRHIYVKKLHRYRIGTVTVKGIRSGEYRKLREDEVSKLLGMVKKDRKGKNIK